MADFRKLVLALAVLALIAVPASAQATFSCTSSGASNTIIRAEGLTEMVGDTLLSCTGTASVNPIVANVQVFLTAPVTNRITSANLTDALLIVGDAAPVRGTLIGGNSIQWSNVTIPGAVPAGTTLAIRMTNIRVNATQAPPSSLGLPGRIQELISISGPTLVPLFPSFVDVALVQNGLEFSAESTRETFQQCTGFNIDEETGEAFRTITLTYEELFGDAFKDRAGESDTRITVGETTFGAQANSGTQLFARFTDVPAGTKLWVSRASTGTTAVATSTATGTAAFVPVTLTNGTGTVTWEVTEATPARETLTFTVVVSVPANIAFTGGVSTTAKVAGGFAPISTVGVASQTAPIPRFADNSQTSNIFNITACVTNLLFPYVTNAPGFDTGIALVNTSKDNGVFDTTPQSGTCTVYYFGAMGNGSQVPGPQTTTEIDGGEMVAFLLSQGGVAGATQGAQSFTGYVIARCNFQFAHGFAFISDLGGTKVAQGYLALVIPDKTAVDGPARTADPFTLAPAGSGEQLGY